MRLRFVLQQCLPSNFSPRPLYTCTPTLKVSFNQRGTLAFAACLSNLTSKSLGHLSLSLSLSLSTSFPPARMHMRSHHSSARASIAPPKRVASEVKHSFARSWTIRDISADKKEKKKQRGQMFAQQTSFQVFPVPPVACRRQEISICQKLGFFRQKNKKLGDKKKFSFGSKEPLFTTEIIEIHFGNGRKFSFRKLNRRVFGKNRIFRFFETLRSRTYQGQEEAGSRGRRLEVCLRRGGRGSRKEGMTL